MLTCLLAPDEHPGLTHQSTRPAQKTVQVGKLEYYPPKRLSEEIVKTKSDGKQHHRRQPTTGLSQFAGSPQHITSNAAKSFARFEPKP